MMSTPKLPLTASMDTSTKESTPQLSRAEGHYFGPQRIHPAKTVKTGLVARLRRH